MSKKSACILFAVIVLGCNDKLHHPTKGPSVNTQGKELSMGTETQDSIELGGKAMDADKRLEDLKLLQGKWKLIEAKYRGQDISSGVGEFMEISEQMWIIPEERRRPRRATFFDINPNTMPKRMDYPKNPEHGQSIYLIENETLTIVQGKHPRPEDFEVGDNDDEVIFKYTKAP
jgi:uncharacterized protein (TIGR03067 family)